jgi:hypothetical protein
LPDNQKSVTEDIYKKVYDNVWQSYQEHKKKKLLWDDQDLARYVLKNNLVKALFSAIFCDETQDFTRIELEIIYRLSIYSERKMPSNLISKIPFAFAGDELQTLNPTGFNWNALTAGYT